MKEDLQEIETFEKRLTKSGIRASGAAEKRVRYQYKMMIVARRRPFLLTFNFTSLNITCPFGRMASALVKPAPTPFCRRDTIDQFAHSRLPRSCSA